MTADRIDRAAAVVRAPTKPAPFRTDDGELIAECAITHKARHPHILLTRTRRLTAPERLAFRAWETTAFEWIRAFKAYRKALHD